MYTKAKKIFSIFLIFVLSGSNFSYILSVNADDIQTIESLQVKSDNDEGNIIEKKEHPKPEKKITFCHVPEGNISNPQTLTTGESAYEKDHFELLPF